MDYDFVDRRLRLRRQRLGAAPRREGLPRRRPRDGQALDARGLPEDELEPAQVPLAARGSACYGILQMTLVKRRVRPARRRASAAAASSTRTRCSCRPTKRSSDAQLAARRRLEARRSRRTTRPRSACSASTETPHRLSTTDELLKEVADEMGRGDTFHARHVGVYFGEPGKTVPDPYFGGEGPERTGCIDCGGCMVGCRFGAKNTLDKNYLYFAEKRGAEIVPETRRRPIVEPLEGGGYELDTRALDAAASRKRSARYRARGVVVSAGVARHGEPPDALQGAAARSPQALAAARPLRAHQQRGAPRRPLRARATSTSRRASRSARGVYRRRQARTSRSCATRAGSDALAPLATRAHRRRRPAAALAALDRQRRSGIRSHFLRTLVPVRLGEADGDPPRHAAARQPPASTTAAALVLAVPKKLDTTAATAGRSPTYIPVANASRERWPTKMDGVRRRAAIIEVAARRPDDRAHPRRLPDGRVTARTASSTRRAASSATTTSTSSTAR